MEVQGISCSRLPSVQENMGMRSVPSRRSGKSKRQGIDSTPITELH